MGKLETKKGSFINLLLWWDIGKKRIQSLTIDYCKEKRRAERIYIQNLKHIEKHLTHLYEQGQIDDTTELFRIQDKIKEYEYKEFNGARLRAKVQEIEQGERSLRCTSYLEKQRANNKIMISLLTEDGTLVETQDEILKETTNFYKRLHTSEKTDVLAQVYLLNNLNETLTDEYKDSIEGEITLNELLIVIKSLASEKSPDVMD